MTVAGGGGLTAVTDEAMEAGEDIADVPAAAAEGTPASTDSSGAGVLPAAAASAATVAALRPVDVFTAVGISGTTTGAAGIAGVAAERLVSTTTFGCPDWTPGPSAAGNKSARQLKHISGLQTLLFMNVVGCKGGCIHHACGIHPWDELSKQRDRK